MLVLQRACPDAHDGRVGRRRVCRAVRAEPLRREVPRRACPEAQEGRAWAQHGQLDRPTQYSTHYLWSSCSHCNTLQHTAPHCTTLHHTAPHCTTLQRTATHCNALQHAQLHLWHIFRFFQKFQARKHTQIRAAAKFCVCMWCCQYVHVCAYVCMCEWASASVCARAQIRLTKLTCS